MLDTPWEDHLLERKTNRQLADIRRTAVAFANTVRPGHTAVILIGEGNDGSVTGVEDADEQQRRVRTELEKIYPPIVWRQQPYDKEGKTCLRVEIEHSGDTPHFGDAAWIRSGSETVKASEDIFQQLVALRSSKVRELLLWKDRTVTLSWAVGYHATAGPNWNKIDCEILRVTQFFATFRVTKTQSERSEPLSWLELSWDDQNKRPRIFINFQHARF